MKNEQDTWNRWGCTHTHRLLLNVNVFSACNELGAGSCLYTQNFISDG